MKKVVTQSEVLIRNFPGETEEYHETYTRVLYMIQKLSLCPVKHQAMKTNVRVEV
jgi:hypothetical protein